MTQDADFKGYIHDVGGPTANFRGRPAPSSAREAPAQTAAVWARSPARR